MAKKYDRDGEAISPVTLTFSKKNEDVYYILKEISQDGTKKTEYICDAIRALYNNNFNSNNTTIKAYDKDMIEKIVIDKVNEILGSKNLQLINKNDLDISDLNAVDLEDD